MIAALSRLIRGHQCGTFPVNAVATHHPPLRNPMQATPPPPLETPYQPGAMTDGYVWMLL